MDDTSRDLIVLLGLLVAVAALLSPWGWAPPPPRDDQPGPRRDGEDGDGPPLPPMH